MEDYGPFASLVANAGSIVAMGAAIGLAWRRRAKWEPSVEDVPAGPERVAGLVAALVIAVIWATSRNPADARFLATLALACGSLALVFLSLYVVVITVFTYEVKVPAGERTVDQHVIIGGFWETDVTKALRKKNKQSLKDMLIAAGYDPDRVWTRSSRGLAKVTFVLAYAGLIVSGGVGLAAAAILVGTTNVQG